MWGFVVLFFGLLIHPRSLKTQRQSNEHRKFYQDGFMREEMDALATQEVMVMNDQQESFKS